MAGFYRSQKLEGGSEAPKLERFMVEGRSETERLQVLSKLGGYHVLGHADRHLAHRFET